MDNTTMRTILVYLLRPEDTSTEGPSPPGSVGDGTERELSRFGLLKTCLWICLAVLFALFLSRMS